MGIQTKITDNVRKILLDVVGVLLIISVVFFTISEYLFYNYKSRLVAVLHSNELSVILIRNKINLIVFCIVLVLILVLIVFYISEKKQSGLNIAASKIRKLLLEVSVRPECVKEALKIITDSADSRAAFYIDTELKSYTFINDEIDKNKYLSKDELKELASYLLECAERRIDSNINIITIDINKKIVNPKLREFMIAHNLDTVIFSAIVEDDDHMSLLGVENPMKDLSIVSLLKEISVCFSMSIYNKEYLEKTNRLVITDSLTKLYNRTGYNKDIEDYYPSIYDGLVCVYVDVNELHIINNKLGHSAGDNMLRYVAYALKEEFSDYRVYRMGGDEFLIFTTDLLIEEVEEKVKKVNCDVDARNYHISVGLAAANETPYISELVKIAEGRMYDNKSVYYQNKKGIVSTEIEQVHYEKISTGIKEIDDLLTIFGTRYKGAHIVNFKDDSCKNIYIASYFSEMQETENGKFSKAVIRYVDKLVEPDYQRSFISFINYDSIRKTLISGSIPSLSYQKINGEFVTLTVYAVPGNEEFNETIWIFE